MQVKTTSAQLQTDRTDILLRRISHASASLALGCGLAGLGGWIFDRPAWRTLNPPWPPLMPEIALGVCLCAIGLFRHRATRHNSNYIRIVLGAVVLLWGFAGFLPEHLDYRGEWGRKLGLLIANAQAADLPPQPSMTDSLILLLAGLAVMRLYPSKRSWLEPSTLFGSILFSLSLLALITRSGLPPEAAPGVSGLSALAALFLGLALITARFNSGLLVTFRADSATGIIGRRLLLLVGLLPPALYLLQLSDGISADYTDLEKEMLTSLAFTYSLIGVMVFSLYRLHRLDVENKRVEEERDRLLYRVQQQAAQLQHEVATRTNELKQLNDRHRLALQGSNYGVWDWDVIAGEHIWDATLLRIYGRTPDTFSGKNEEWFRHIHPEDLPMIRQIDWSKLAPHETLSLAYRIIRADGSIRHLRMQGQPEFSPTGRLQRVVGLVRDETEDKEREMELNSLSERLRFVVSAAGYGVWEYDFHGDRLYWDDNLIKLHGLQRAAVQGGIETWRQRVHPEDWTEVQHHLNEVIAGRREELEPEYRIILPNATVRTMQMRSYLIRKADGTPQRLVGLNRDVTAAREMREQLRISEERWRLVINSNNDGVWDWDMPNDRYFRDQRFAEMLGIAPAEVPANHDAFVLLMHPDDREAAQAALQAHRNGQATYYQCEYRLMHRNNQWIWIQDRGKIVAHDSRGHPLRMVGTQSDITARKTLEEKLRHNEKLSLQLNRLAQIGAWDEDISTGRITWAPEVYRIHEVDLGYTPVAQDLERFYPPESRTVLAEAFQQARTDGTPFDLELPFTTARGHRLWIRILSQAEMSHGHVTRLFGGFQDITARREAEEMRRQLESQLFQAQKMETLGTLAGGIAHDFNNLLTGILGYQDLAFDGLPADHESRPYLEASRDASLRARELVDQILTFSRQSGSKMTPVNLSTIVEDARRFLRSTVPATIRIESNIAPDCEPVLADASQLHQVLLNLGTNAAHAMKDKGGVMRVTLYPTTIAEGSTYNQLAPGKYLRLDFSDNGHGMDEATRKRIFDPFFTTKDVGHGTGLGLSLVHSILEAHNGTITVESTEGQGTTFSLLLPVAELNDLVTHPTNLPTPRGQSELVAIVDDEDLVRNFVQISLERAGYRVVAFDRAAACLEEIRKHSADFSALLTDQTMPEMNGTELAMEVHAIAPTMPVIIMSGYYSRIAPELLTHMGRVTLITKPFTTEELAHSVHSCVRPGSIPPFPIAVNP